MFRKIGQFEIRADNDVILVWSSPTFNLEAAQEYGTAMAELIRGMPPRFGLLAQFDEPPIMGPEVEAAMREGAKYRAQRGLVAVAFFTANHHGIAIASGQWNRIYDPIGIPFAFFDKLEDARAWLRAKIDNT